MKRTTVARIDEDRCIGCTRCIEACPVDAIVGAHQLMHTVVEPWCIGCALCLPPCPVDCIDMIAAKGAWTAGHKAAAKQRARHRKLRLAQPEFVSAAKNRRAVIAAALARKRR